MPSPPTVTIPSSEVRLLESNHVDQEFELSVALPPGYEGSDKRYPVLYALDSNGMFVSRSWGALQREQVTNLPVNPLAPTDRGARAHPHSNPIRLRCWLTLSCSTPASAVISDSGVS